MDYAQRYATQPSVAPERTARPELDWEADLLEREALSRTLRKSDDGPEFSSEPMPAAFAACLFLSAGLVVCLALALFW